MKAAPWLTLLAVSIPATRGLSAADPWIAVDKSGRGFVLSPSGARFIPWGFNYSRDDRFRPIEDYWADDGPEGWAKVAMM